MFCKITSWVRINVIVLVFFLDSLLLLDQPRKAEGQESEKTTNNSKTAPPLLPNMRSADVDLRFKAWRVQPPYWWESDFVSNVAPTVRNAPIGVLLTTVDPIAKRVKESPKPRNQENTYVSDHDAVRAWILVVSAPRKVCHTSRQPSLYLTSPWASFVLSSL